MTFLYALKNKPDTYAPGPLSPKKMLQLVWFLSRVVVAFLAKRGRKNGVIVFLPSLKLVLGRGWGG